MTWHLVALLAPLGLLIGWTEAIVVWTAYWVVPMVVALPILRFVAEAGKHRYESGKSEFEAAISNLGFIHRLILHPDHDGFHALHHMEPCIPFFNLPRADRFLSDHQTEYATRRLIRTRVLEEPSRDGSQSLDA